MPVCDAPCKNARYFGRGADDRFAGLPFDAGKPIYWQRGWRHVQAVWGKDARWPVRPLPDVVLDTQGIALGLGLSPLRGEKPRRPDSQGLALG